MKCIILFGILLSGTFAAPSYKKPKFRGGLNKIVGGTEVTPGELPYQLSYQDLSLGQFYHYCGASIYNENWAICAGHCVNGEDMDNPDYLRVVAGEHNLDVEEGNEQAIVLSRIIQHEDYDSFNYGNDISVLQLSEPLVFNEFVQPIPLPEPGHAATGDCIVSGWGTTSEDGQSSSTLRKVSVPIITDMECRDIYDWSDVEDSMVCAGDLNGGRDACQGDSGGPLVCSDTGSSYLGGIVSWGYGCARPDFPGVYTEVAYFVDWVKANTE